MSAHASWVIEAEHMKVSDNDTETMPQNNRLMSVYQTRVTTHSVGLHSLAVNECRGFPSKLESDLSLIVGEGAVLGGNVWPGQLDLCFLAFQTTDNRHTRLQLVDETFGHEGILVQVDQGRVLLRSVHTDHLMVSFIPSAA